MSKRLYYLYIKIFAIMPLKAFIYSL